MSAESVLSTLGLGELLARDFLAVQLVILAATGGLFAMSLAMMIMAARSAGGARKARTDAEAQLRSAQDFVVEARQLSAQIERGASRPVASAAASPPPIRVSARETTPEAEIEIINARHDDGAASPAERKLGNRNLDAAKEAATVPKSLLGAFRRRRQ